MIITELRVGDFVGKEKRKGEIFTLLHTEQDISYPSLFRVTVYIIPSEPKTGSSRFSTGECMANPRSPLWELGCTFIIAM